MTVFNGRAALFLKEPFAAAFGKNNNFTDFFGFSGKGAELIWEFFFFFGIFFFRLGGFGAVQAPFWENSGVKGRFVRVFQDMWGWF